jgi:CRP/FNR family cyclic AMP-dependent transcriptional regulator
MKSQRASPLLRALQEKGVPMRLREWQAGELLFAPDDPADALFLVQTGYVRLYRLTETGKEVLLRWCGSGDVFGEESLTTHVRRHFAEGITKGKAWQVNAQQLLMVAEQDGSLKTALLFALHEAARMTEEVVASVAEEVPRRLVKALRWLAEKANPESTDGFVALPLTHAQLASLIGTSRECVTVHLKPLQQVGLLISKRGKLLLRLLSLRQGQNEGKVGLP